MVSYCTGSKFGKVREGERDIQNAVQKKNSQQPWAAGWESLYFCSRMQLITGES